jgi:hypothetical protein
MQSIEAVDGFVEIPDHHIDGLGMCRMQEQEAGQYDQGMFHRPRFL